MLLVLAVARSLAGVALGAIEDATAGAGDDAGDGDVAAAAEAAGAIENVADADDVAAAAVDLAAVDANTDGAVGAPARSPAFA